MKTEKMQQHIAEIIECADCIDAGGRYIDSDALREAADALIVLERDRNDLRDMLRGIQRNIGKALDPIGGA